MREIKAPEPLVVPPGMTTIFLAGSIEQGRASDWQAAVVAALHDRPVVIFNPRRAHWDATWPQDANEPRFREQVEWELAALERADQILLYFDPATRAPISLLELGLFAQSGKLVVACPPGFWRRGNVEIVCQRYGVPFVADVPALIAVARGRVS